MSRLILSMDGQVLAEYNMNKERYTIGRLPDNDIRIDNAAVSGHHSLIINILNDSFLEDLNSTNGTYVNGKLIKKHALQHADVITVGQHQLRFVEVDEQQEEFEKTMVIDSSARAAIARQAAALQGQADGLERSRSSDADRSLRLEEAHTPLRQGAAARSDSNAAPTPAAYGRAADEGYQRTLPDVSPMDSHRAPPPGAQPVRTARLQVLSGAFAGRELELNKALTTLGRPGLQVAAITRRAEGFYIVQVENKTGGDSPLLNGTPIGAQATKLNDNDVIQLAGVKMGFFEG